jgi:hypothetical protein
MAPLSTIDFCNQYNAPGVEKLAGNVHISRWPVPDICNPVDVPEM